MKYTGQSTNKYNAFQYVMDNPAAEFTDEDDIKGIKITNKDYRKINRETYEMKLQLDSRGYYSSRLAVLICICFQQGNTVSFMNYIFSNSLIIHAALTQPEHLILVRWMSLETQ